MGTNTRRQSRGLARVAAAREAREKAARRRRRMPWYFAGTAVLVVVVGLIVVLATGGGDGSNATGPTGTTTPTATTFAYGTGPCAPSSPPQPPTLDFSGTDGFQDCLVAGTQYIATFDTTAGQVTVQLDTTDTPGTANNFVQLAGWGYYDGTKLFRTDTSIGIIQGGAPHTNDASDPGPGFTIPDEGSGFTYQPGQLVMARTSGANSAGAQFFFTVDDKASSLDAQGTYVVFGQVINGLDVLQKILASNVDSGSLGGAPNPPVTVNTVTIGTASLTG